MSETALLDHQRNRIAACYEGDPSGVLDPQAIGEADRLWHASGDGDDKPVPVVYLRAQLHWCRYLSLPVGPDEADLGNALRLFAAVAPDYPDLLPGPVRARLGADDPRARTPMASALLHQAAYADDAPALGKALEELRALAADGTDHAPILINLATALHLRFERDGDAADLDEAVRIGRRAVDASRPTDPAHPDVLAGHAATLQRRWSLQAETADLDEAIALAHRAIDASSFDHSRHAQYLHILAGSLVRRFEHSGTAADLEAAVGLSERLEQAAAADDPIRAEHYGGLAGAMLRWFDRTTDRGAAIRIGRLFADAVPDDQRVRAPCLSELAGLIWDRYTDTGDDTDLDEAIAVQYQAVAPAPVECPDAALHHSELGGYLRLRYERTGDGADLEAALRHCRKASAEAPTDRGARTAILERLGAVLLVRHRHLGDDADLDEGITAMREAADGAPDDHPSMAVITANLSGALTSRFRRHGRDADLDEAIELGRRALEVAAGESDRALAGTDLALALMARFDHTGHRGDLDEAIGLARGATEAATGDHPDRARHLWNRSILHSRRFERDGDAADLDETIDALREAAATGGAGIAVRIRAGQHAARALVGRDRLTGEPSTTEAGFAEALPLYRDAIELLPLLVWHGMELTDQRRLLEDLAASLGREAAACAIAVGEPALAARLLEQSRSVLWGQLLDLRTGPAQLRRAHPALAERLEQCVQALDPHTDADGVLLRPGPADHGRARIATGRRFEALIAEIRALPPTDAFPRPEDFLRPPELETLLPPEGTGPVAVLNVSRWRSDALIATADGVSSIPLDVTEADATAQIDHYLRALHRYTSPGDDLPLEMATRPILEWAWDRIARPVLDRIGATESTDRPPRIWWCPTGPLTLLPIHAAGHHGRRDGRTVIDRAVSSYTPTLRSLAEARTRPPSPTDEAPLLAVAVSATAADPDRTTDLPGAATELALLRDLFDHRPPTALTDGDATGEAILTRLDEHPWVHIACHGTQNLARPGEGGLLPHDWPTNGPITIGDLAGTDRRGGEFAFLSACQTATGGTTSLDEAVNLTAAMQYSGWRHVIGTLWTIDDDTAAALAGHFYPRLLRDGRLDPADSARALHDAVRALRDRHPDGTARWARFIHVGP